MFININEPSEQQWFDELIHSMFDYYNGKVNIFNPAVLQVDWLNHEGSKRAASARNPNVVNMYPRVLIRENQNVRQICMLNTMLVVIHELFHIDQDIDYVQMMHNPKYVQLIESHVEVQVAEYLMYHQRDLAFFGITMPVNVQAYLDEVYAKYDTGSLYQRRDYLSHCMSCLKDICFASHNLVIGEFWMKMASAYTQIDVQINDTCFNLKTGCLCMPVEQLNGILESEYFRFNLRSAKVTFNKIGDEKYLLKIKADCKNLMMRRIPS